MGSSSECAIAQWRGVPEKSKSDIDGSVDGGRELGGAWVSRGPAGARALWEAVGGQAGNGG